MTSEEFDDMVKAIRVGAAVSSWLFVQVAVSHFLLHSDRLMTLPALDIALVVLEMTIYAACTIAIWNLSRIGATVLFYTCMAKMLLTLMGGVQWGLLVGVIFLFVIYRSMRTANRLHDLLVEARARTHAHAGT
jgi:hypothetical protein